MHQVPRNPAHEAPVQACCCSHQGLEGSDLQIYTTLQNGETQGIPAPYYRGHHAAKPAHRQLLDRSNALLQDFQWLDSVVEPVANQCRQCPRVVAGVVALDHNDTDDRHRDAHATSDDEAWPRLSPALLVSAVPPFCSGSLASRGLPDPA